MRLPNGLIKKIEDNKAAVLLGLSYLNRYYGWSSMMSISNSSCCSSQTSMVRMLVDRLINRFKEDYIKGTHAHDAFNEVVAKSFFLEILWLPEGTIWNSLQALQTWMIGLSKQPRICLYCDQNNNSWVYDKHRAYEAICVHGKMNLCPLELKMPICSWFQPTIQWLIVPSRNMVKYGSGTKCLQGGRW